MTRQGWADKIANKAFLKAGGALFNGDVQPLLLAEHRRAVRVVTAEIKRVKLDRHNYSMVTRAEMTKCLDRLLAALQRGRE